MTACKFVKLDIILPKKSNAPKEVLGPLEASYRHLAVIPSHYMLQTELNRIENLQRPYPIVDLIKIST